LDLVALVPGKDDREALDGLLSTRPRDLGMRPVVYEMLVHTRRDPGCYHEAPETLRPYHRRATHALVLFDHEGCGQENVAAETVAQVLRARLAMNGWDDRAEVLVVEPEIEAWVWSASSIVEDVLGWAGRRPALREWLADRRFWPQGMLKPPRPKEAWVAALREAGIRKSAALYRTLAEEVNLGGCRDPAFQRLCTTLRTWFPAES
jgi:hypothetical protein